MADMMKKAAGYIQVKLVPEDRNGQTWSGWAQRWVDLLVVSDDSGQSKLERTPEVWLEVRKSKSSGKPIKVWTLMSKNTVLYRCTSKRKGHAFAVQYKGKDILYLSGNSETESHDWMKIIRESLSPTNKIVEVEISAGKLFEASVIDNSYSASCGLFGKYGHLSCREIKLIMFDNNGMNVIQEWYLHTIRKLEAFKANQQDTGRLLSIHFGENSSTGYGVIYFYCWDAVSLMRSIETCIREVFNNIGDDRKNQQATLMSLGALHDVSLEESEVKEPLKSLVIADEIIKAKQELSQSGRLQAMKLNIPEATNKNEPFVWEDNELYDKASDESPVKADYIPPDEEPPRKPRRAPLAQSLNFIRRPRANSLNPQSEASKPKGEGRRGSLPQSGRFYPKSLPEFSENEMAAQMLRFQHILNLADQENSEQIFPVVGSPRRDSSVGSGEIASAVTKLSALDECSEESTSLTASLSSDHSPSLNEEKATDTLDGREVDANTNADGGSEHDDSTITEVADTTTKSIDLMDPHFEEEPELDLRLREPPECSEADNQTGVTVPADIEKPVNSENDAQTTNSGSLVEADEAPATISVRNIDIPDRRQSTHAVTINFGAPPKPKRTRSKES